MVNHKSTYQLQATAANQDRLDRMNAFQRQTLIDLQESIHDAMRLTTQAHLADRKSHSEGNEWGKSLLKNDLDEDLRIAKRRVSILVERVLDDDLRAQIKSLMKSVSDALFASDEAGARELIVTCYKEANESMEAIGIVLRRYY